MIACEDAEEDYGSEDFEYESDEEAGVPVASASPGDVLKQAALEPNPEHDIQDTETLEKPQKSEMKQPNDFHFDLDLLKLHAVHHKKKKGHRDSQKLTQVLESQQAAEEATTRLKWYRIQQETRRMQKLKQENFEKEKHRQLHRLSMEEAGIGRKSPEEWLHESQQQLDAHARNQAQIEMEEIKKRWYHSKITPAPNLSVERAAVIRKEWQRTERLRAQCDQEQHLRDERIKEMLRKAKQCVVDRTCAYVPGSYILTTRENKFHRHRCELWKENLRAWRPGPYRNEIECMQTKHRPRRLFAANH